MTQVETFDETLLQLEEQKKDDECLICKLAKQKKEDKTFLHPVVEQKNEKRGGAIY